MVLPADTIGFFMVLVIETSLIETIWVPQSAQNLDVSGLSVLHFGHFIATSSLCFGRQNIIKENVRCQIDLREYARQDSNLRPSDS